MNLSIVISSSRTKSTIPGSSRVAMVMYYYLLDRQRDAVYRLYYVSTGDIFIADSTSSSLFWVRINIKKTVSRVRETTARIDIGCWHRTVTRHYYLLHYYSTTAVCSLLVATATTILVVHTATGNCGKWKRQSRYCGWW